MKPIFTLSLCLSWLPLSAIAQVNSAINDAPLHVANDAITPTQGEKIPPHFAQHDREQIIELNDAELLQQPELIRQLLNQMIDAQQFTRLADLLALYQQTPNPDPVLIDYAKAHLALLADKPQEGIALLQGILAQHPEFAPVRFLLARTLFEDYQNRSARSHFQQLQQSPLPASIEQATTYYLQGLNQREEWDFSLNFSYLQENNVNNASPSETIRVGNALFQKSSDSLPQKAHGVQYGFSIAKKWALWRNHSLRVENDFFAKQYWDNHRYDDLTNRTALGYHYQNMTNTFALLPFYERRWFGGHRYSKGNGIRGEFEHWFSPKWRLSLASEWGSTRQSAAEERLADNRGRLYSATLMHIVSPKTYLYGGVDYSRERAKSSIYDFNRRGIRLGWGQQWWGNVNSRLNLSYGEKGYLTPNRILQKIRHDKEISVRLNLWKSDWHYKGFTPKLTLSWHRVKSNLPDLYGYDKKRVYLNVEKLF
ncbi:hypothetical protein A4G19_15140 [Pasteurellaceae bacterium Macca]|nr:hypothetical protein [Pasteurellaceae bacterium Macca]